MARVWRVLAAQGPRHLLIPLPGTVSWFLLGDVPCVVETRDGLTCQKVSSLTYAASEPEGIARVKPLSCLRVLHFERLLFC